MSVADAPPVEEDATEADGVELAVDGLARAQPRGTRTEFSLGKPAAWPYVVGAIPGDKGALVASVRDANTLVVQRFAPNGSVDWTFERRIEGKDLLLDPIGAIVSASDGTAIIAGAEYVFAVAPNGRAFRWKKDFDIFWGDLVGLTYEPQTDTVVVVASESDANGDPTTMMRRLRVSDGQQVGNAKDVWPLGVAAASAVALPNRRTAVLADMRVFVFDERFELVAKSSEIGSTGRGYSREAGMLTYSARDNTLVATAGAIPFVEKAPQPGEDLLWKLRADTLETVWIKRRTPKKPGRGFDLGVVSLPDGRLVLGGRVFEVVDGRSTIFGVNFEVRDESGGRLTSRIHSEERTFDRNVNSIAADGNVVYQLSITKKRSAEDVSKGVLRRFVF
jgi:hypothetical protein